MALESLKYHSQQHRLEETKRGAPIYNGNARDFYSWRFRTELRTSASEQRVPEGDIDDVAERQVETNKREVLVILEGLRGDALQVAMDMGTDELTSAGGIGKLIKNIELLVHPQKHLEAKELYSAGHSKNGMLSKQPGESMLSYISRRRRWWTLLKEMDSTLQLSDQLRGDLLLDSSGLSHSEKLMIMTSTNNSTLFDTLADALVEQHGKRHLREDRNFQPRRFNPKFARQKRIANLAGEWQDEEYEDAWQEEWEDQEEQVAFQAENEDDYSDCEEDVEAWVEDEFQAN